MALLFLALGLFMALLQAPKQEREWRRIEAYPELDKGRYTAVPAGEQLVLSGQLQDNATLNRYEMVAYRVEEWVVSTDDDGDETGSWHTLEVDVPALALAVPGGVVKTAAVGSLSMSGQLHEFMEPSDRRTTAPYEGRSLAEGSIRTQGFRNRDLVTVVGRKINDGGLQPERLHAGDRASLVDLLRGNVLALRIIGGVFMAVGAVLLGVMGWLTWRQQRTQTDDRGRGMK
jgi:hypothetical protein